jgi:hypothetical protein
MGTTICHPATSSHMGYHLQGTTVAAFLEYVTNVL